ncbi:hypothetical protein [Cellulomonas cellasea]|uniref:Uncharacterized protein n=2 Tax=Cellulomonas cellasea TaxID=43670 RepID=A0A0A0B677_9CELL|nr:hypothetical protein [Cellulomonas cellasea]KGM01693.1 hypothetical protein Q760_17970 [Cellulomonas cellasea DSM 20118]GEA88817.1 hypothetical protein CCE01nite_27660 [Cellulomonas cellasea]
MRRLFWVAVGATVTLVAVRRARDVVTGYLPAGTGEALGVVQQVTTAARTARSEFLAGLAEREEQLTHDLVGDVDVDALREERARRRAAEDAEPAARGRRAAHRRPATEDPDDADGDLPYSFY